MRSLIAFIKKDVTEQMRSGKLTVLALLFVLFGVMNPAVAKLTPWLLETMADSLASSGMTVTVVDVSAMDSWVQFFKNIPMALIAFILIESSIFTKEYSSGTLILSLTKGLERFKVIISKTAVLLFLWTLGYLVCFFITYAYNEYFWDNAVAQNLVFSAICWWTFGVFTIAFTVLFSTLSSSSAGVLCGVGGVAFASYMLGLFPKLGKYLPTRLTDGNSLIYGLLDVKDYLWSLMITAVISLVCFVISVPIFNKKQL